MMRSIARALPATALVLGVAACQSDKLQIPNYNAPTVAGVNADPNGVQLLATGVLLALRGDRDGFTFDTGIFGRESYDYFPTDARAVSHYLIGQPAPGGGKQLDPAGFASGNWNGHYANVKNTLNLRALADASKTLSDQQKSAVRGFAQTVEGLELWYLIVTRDTLGIPVVIPADPTKPSPFVTRTQAFQGVQAILDSGKAALQAAGTTAFPFTLHAGFAGFDTPATFLKFNRAIAARVDNDYAQKGCGNACYTAALAALGQSFVSPLGASVSRSDLDVGVYNVYSATPGDALNGQNHDANPNYLAHASARTQAETKANGALDDRAMTKVDTLVPNRPAPGTGNGITAVYYFSMYPTTTTPSAIIRNEELMLIRAEANMELGSTAQALVDINTVRTTSGGLAPLASLGSDPIATLLYERHMSLLNEGHRWNDMRRFGRLNQLPLDITQAMADADTTKTLKAHFIAKVMPIPTTECNARQGTTVVPAIGC